MKKQGTVKWFSKIKGYGFIQPEDNGREVFVHYSALTWQGYRNLEEGQTVEYDEQDRGRGPIAAAVVVKE